MIDKRKITAGRVFRNHLSGGDIFKILGIESVSVKKNADESVLTFTNIDRLRALNQAIKDNDPDRLI